MEDNSKNENIEEKLDKKIKEIGMMRIATVAAMYALILGVYFLIAPLLAGGSIEDIFEEGIPRIGKDMLVRLIGAIGLGLILLVLRLDKNNFFTKFSKIIVAIGFGIIVIFSNILLLPGIDMLIGTDATVSIVILVHITMALFMITGSVLIIGRLNK